LGSTRRAHARLRARQPRIRQVILEKVENISYCVTRCDAQRVQPRARPCGARQSILLIMEMTFDYLIATLDEKAEKIQLLQAIVCFSAF